MYCFIVLKLKCNNYGVKFISQGVKIKLGVLNWCLRLDSNIRYACPFDGYIYIVTQLL